MSCLREQYPDRYLSATTVFPSFTDNPLEAYNSVLSIHHLVENSDLVTV